MASYRFSENQSDRLAQLEQILAPVLPPIDPDWESRNTDKSTQQKLQPRCSRVTFAMTAQEESWLKERAQGVKMSAYIRSILFTGSPPRPRPIVPAINRETYVGLRQIGHNLNQQTRLLHGLIGTQLEGIQVGDQRDFNAQLRAALQANLEQLHSLYSLVDQAKLELIAGESFDDVCQDY